MVGVGNIMMRFCAVFVVILCIQTSFVDSRKALLKEISNEISTGPVQTISKQKMERRYDQQVSTLEDVLPSHVAKIRAGLIKPKSGKGHWKKVSLKPNTAGDQDNMNLQRVDYEPRKAVKVKKIEAKKKYRRLFKKPTKMGKKMHNIQKDEKYRKYKKHMKKKYNNVQRVERVQTP